MKIFLLLVIKPIDCTCNLQFGTDALRGKKERGNQFCNPKRHTYVIIKPIHKGATIAFPAKIKAILRRDLTVNLLPVNRSGNVRNTTKYKQAEGRAG